MRSAPLKLLLVSYGASAAVALGAAPWLGALGAVLAFWLGGAGVVILCALTPRLRAFFAVAEASPSGEDEDAALARALRAWEEDRLSDRAESERRRQLG